MTNFTVELEVDREDAYHLYDVEVEVTSYEPYTPARLHGNPDFWCPAEGGEVEYDIISIDGEDSEIVVQAFYSGLGVTSEEKLTELVIKTLEEEY